MKTKYNQGYIALLVMLITGVIIVILMLQQYRKSGLIKQDNSKLIDSEVLNNTVTPIDSAKNIKDVLEKRDQGLLNN
jgi:uncharacterized membrane protein